MCGAAKLRRLQARQVHDEAAGVGQGSVARISATATSQIDALRNPNGIECLYTYSTCQVIERFVGIQTAFEVNNPATVAQLPTTTINRARAW